MSTLATPLPAARAAWRLEPGAWLGVLGAALVLALWEFAARFLWRDAQVLPAPTQAIATAWAVLTLRELAEHVGASLWRIVAGFALGALAGVGLGIAAGWYPALARLVRPLVEILRPIVVIDGLFAPAPAGGVVFHPATAIDPAAIATVQATLRRRLLAS
ncbi:MAG: hypothetical protein IT518_29450, partial [Burkholderiales bacterium]|nr:hypothetical protein [Burkholderiales bacterium]